MDTRLESYDWEYAMDTESYDFCSLIPRDGKPPKEEPRECARRSDVAEVLKIEEGENEERDWLLLAKLNSGEFLAFRAGCDYTGWG